MRLLLFVLVLLCATPASPEVRTWRVGDAAHPWRVTPVSGITHWGSGWAVEVLLDEDGDGLIDEDPVELVDNDGDGLINEDPADPQRDDDGDGLINEDPVNGIDDDGDGLIDEDEVQRFDNDRDGLVNEDGPDPQIDNDGDGRLNEDGLWTFTDDDYDGLRNEDPPEPGGPDDQVDNDGDGLINEDPYGQMTGTARAHPVRYDALGDDDCYRLDDNIFDPATCDGPDEDPFNGLDDDGDGAVDEDGLASELTGQSTWLSPVYLDATREVISLVGGRQARAQFGDGIIHVPGEGPVRKQAVKTFYSAHSAQFPSYYKTFDRQLFTAYGSSTRGITDVGTALWGYYPITRLLVRPRPSLPAASPQDYIVYYGAVGDVVREAQAIRQVLVPASYGQDHIEVKDFRFDPPVYLSGLRFQTLVPEGTYWEIAELELWGDGYALDSYYSSEIIDVGTPEPRVRRYEQQWDRYNKTQRPEVQAQFDADVPGDLVTWGRVRWQGRRLGNGQGDIRIQFRAGDTADTHVWQRALGGGLGDSRNIDGTAIDDFTWAKLDVDYLERLSEELLPYNVLGAQAVGSDGPRGWSFWSAPLKFEDGLVDTTLPLSGQGALLALPGQTRYIQFQIHFDSDPHGAIALDWLEFEYGEPTVAEGVLAEIFPPSAPLGRPQEFSYYLTPHYGDGPAGSGFNRVEVLVPDSSTVLKEVVVDDVVWEPLGGPIDGSASDPLATVAPGFVSPSVGQYAHTVIVDREAGHHRLQIKLPELTPQTVPGFAPGVGAPIVLTFSSTLYTGSARFTSSVWHDAGGADSSIPQPTYPGDATPELSTDDVGVVAEELVEIIGSVSVSPNPFTPNRDGANDAALFRFDLYMVTEPVAVTVQLMDLSGASVRTLGPERRAAGPISLVWDGLDERGHLVPPGTYLYRLTTDADEGSPSRLGTVVVAY